MTLSLSNIKRNIEELDPELELKDLNQTFHSEIK